MPEEATHLRDQGDIEGALRAVLGPGAVPPLRHAGDAWSPTRGGDYDPEGKPPGSVGPQEAAPGGEDGSRVGRSVVRAAGESSLAECLRTPTPGPNIAEMD